MSSFSPTFAAKLAKEIYAVTSQSRMSIITTLPEFSGTKDNKLFSGEIGSRLINKSSQFAICIRGTGQYKDDLFLIFRGTVELADVVTDARMGLNVSSTGSLVHSGFNHAFNSMKVEITQFVRQQKGVLTVHCIGHSLGGAVANLAAEWVAKTYAKKVKLYTFGAPRVGFGMTGFANKLTSLLGAENIHRVYHSSDPVPMVPLFPYFHAPTQGHACYLQYGGTINFSAHFMDNYITSVSGTKSWQTMHKPELGLSNTSIKRWLKHNSSENVHSAYAWARLNQAISFVVKSALSTVALPVVGGMTIADYLAMILQKGLKMAGDAAQWVLLLIRKMMRMLSMKVIGTIEELTEQLLRLVLNRITRKIYSEARRAVDFM